MGTKPFGIAVDDVYVYFSAIDIGIHRAPKLGGPIDLLAADDRGPHVIVADGEWIYAADLGTPPTDFRDGRIVRVSKSAGGLQVLASSLEAPGDLRVAGDQIYFSTIGTHDYGAYNNDGAIWRMPKDGSTPPVRLAKDQLHPAGMAVDFSYVYWVTDYGGQVMRCALAGCDQKPDVLYADQNVPRSIVVDDAWLYWTNQQGTNVVRAPKNGGGAVEELAGSRGFPESIVLDGPDLFWCESLTHTVMRLPKTGAVRPMAVAEDLGLPTIVVVDRSSVYFSDQGRDDVVRVPR